MSKRIMPGVIYLSPLAREMARACCFVVTPENPKRRIRDWGTRFAVVNIRQRRDSPQEGRLVCYSDA